MSKQLYDVGVALSGGGIRGVAHLGVLKALEEFGLKPNIISGVSAGAIVGSLYAVGYSIPEIEDFFIKSSFSKNIRFNMPKNGGITSSKGYRNYLESYLGDKTFEDLDIPLIVNAAELFSGHNEYFSTGSLVNAVVASASVPVLFSPAEINDKLYVDGGIFCNLPAEVIRPKCKLLIGVHVNPILPIKKSTNVGLINVAERVFHLAINGNTFHEKSFCDLVIDMKRNKSIGMFESSKSSELYDMGYETAVKALSSFDFSNFDFLLKK